MDALVVILTTAITLALALARTGRNAASQNTAVVTRALDVLIVLGLAAICSGVALVHASMTATAAVMGLWIMTVLTTLALNRHLDRYEHTARVTANSATPTTLTSSSTSMSTTDTKGDLSTVASTSSRLRVEN